MASNGYNSRKKNLEKILNKDKNYLISSDEDFLDRRHRFYYCYLKNLIVKKKYDLPVLTRKKKIKKIKIYKR